MNKRLASHYLPMLLGEPEVSQEAGGDKIEELEYIFFLKVRDFEQLSTAKEMEHQEQWSILFVKHGIETSVRVRRTVKNGVETFILATKINVEGVKGKWELEQKVEREHFDKIKSMAESGMVKDRYFFPIEGSDLVWEIDVFKDHEGNQIPWVKVDLEVPAALDRIPAFPVQFTDSVVKQPKQRDEKEANFVSRLFRDHYVVSPMDDVA